MESASPLDVLVIGVANVDLVTRVPHVPTDGETVFGSDLAVIPGGKGLNQAIAVSRYGGRAALAAKAGDDAWGDLLRRTLVAAGVDTTAFTLVPAGATAAVLVHVPSTGDSAVTVTRTATTLHTLADIEVAQPLLDRAAVTVVQLELDSPVIARAVSGARGRTIGTLAPMNPLPPTILAALDVIVVNAAEAARILGRAVPTGVDAIVEAAKTLLPLGPAAAVVTAGSSGAAYADRSQHGMVATPETVVVDTTGAGDALLGVMALALARGADLPDAVKAGVAAGTHAVQTLGANGSTRR